MNYLFDTPYIAEDCVSSPLFGRRESWRSHNKHNARNRKNITRVQRGDVDANENQSAKTAFSEHLGYLRRLVETGVVTSELANKARVVWLVALVEVGEDLPVPAAAAFSGGPIEYHWSSGSHQLSAEILAAGPCHWTYRNNDSGELWGGEVPTDDGYPRRLVDYLTRIAASAN